MGWGGVERAFSNEKEPGLAGGREVGWGLIVGGG